MMKSVLKTLALSFGGGLALGAGIRLTQGPPGSRRQPPVDLDPLLGRLQNVEKRVVQMESTARAEAAAGVAAPDFAAAAGQTLAEFETRLADQFIQIDQLRDRFGEVDRLRDELGEVGQLRSGVDRVDRRLKEVDHRLGEVDHRLGGLDTRIPVIVQQTVDLHFEQVEKNFKQVEQKLRQDFDQAQRQTVSAFQEMLENKVVGRITELESNLSQQSSDIGKLRDASLKTDANLQKMLLGIERLLEQSRTPPPAAQAPPPASPEPSHREPEFSPGPAVIKLSEVQTREEPAPVLISESPPGAGLPEDVPVLARVPEISEFDVTKPVDGNGAAGKNAPAAVPLESETPQPVTVAAEASAAEAQAGPPKEGGEPSKDESYEWVNRIGLELLAPRPKPRPAWRMPLAVGLAAGLIVIAGLFYSGVPQRYFEIGGVQPQTSALASTSPAPPASAPTGSSAAPGDLQSLEHRAAAKPADAAALVDLAREYARRKDWAKAESTYRSALAASPGNRDAALGLSDVLYQEAGQLDSKSARLKYEESAEVLNKLSSSKTQ